MPAFVSSIFGVTEPAIYGVTLPMKTPFYISCGVSGLMGAAMMALDIKMYSIGGLGVFVFPSLIGPDGNLSKVIFAIIIAIVGALVSFAVSGTIIWSYGLIMAAAMIAGAVVGTRLAIKKGASYVRPLYLLVTTLLIGKQVYEILLK